MTEKRWSLINHVLWRFNNNMNWLCAIDSEGSSKTGTGKSWAGLSICWACAEEDKQRFNINHVVFKVKDLIGLIHQGVPKGSMFLFDEAGLGIPAREFWSESNRLMSFLVQSFRLYNIGVVMTLPHLSMLDRHARLLLNNRITMLGRVHGKYGCAKIKFVDVKENGTVIFPYPVVSGGIKIEPNKERGEKHNIIIPKPPDFLIKDYEDLKKSMVDNLVADMDSKLSGTGHVAQTHGFIKNYVDGLNDVWKIKTDERRLCYVYEHLISEGHVDKLGIKKKDVSDVLNSIKAGFELNQGVSHLRDLRDKGMSYRKIGDAVGMSYSQVRNILINKKRGDMDG